MPVDPNIQNLLNVIASSSLPAIADGTPEQARQGIDALLVGIRNPGALPPIDSTADAVVPGPAGDIPVRVYRPAGAGTRPTIVYYHGGGFVIGNIETHDEVCRRLCADTESVVVSVDYRLAPEHPFPAAVEDAYAALEHVIANVTDYGGGKVAVGGDSAGGNLSAVMAQQAHTDGLPLAAQLLVYPAVDLAGDFPSRVENAEGYFLSTRDMAWFGLHYLGLPADGTLDAATLDADGLAGLATANGLDGVEVAALLTDPRISPLKAKSLEGLAPAVVVTAEYDPLRDEGNTYAAALTDAGVAVVHRQFPGLIHGFYGLEIVSPAAAEATRWVNEQFKAVLAG